MGATLLRRAWFTGKIFPLMMPLGSRLTSCSLNSRLPSLRTKIFFLGEVMIGHDVQLVASNQISNICKCVCPMHCKRAIVRAGGCMQSCGQAVALHVPCTTNVQSCGQVVACNHAGRRLHCMSHALMLTGR